MTDPQEVRQYIANLIRTRRLALRMDQSALAAQSGISQAALSRYESAAASIRAEDVPRIAEALRIEPQEFFVGTMRVRGEYMAPEWNEAEARLIANFRSLPPEERLEAFRSIQRQVNESSATWMEYLEAISIGGKRYGDSGVVSKNADAEERETS